MTYIIKYELSTNEIYNDNKWKTKEEDTGLMEQSMIDIVNHYQSQGVRFWAEICRPDKNYQCLTSIGNTKEECTKNSIDKKGFGKAQELVNAIHKHFVKDGTTILVPIKNKVYKIAKEEKIKYD